MKRKRLCPSILLATLAAILTVAASAFALEASKDGWYHTGDGVRTKSVAFINVRTPSRNSTPSVGKWILAFTHVLSRKYSSRSSACLSRNFPGFSMAPRSSPSISSRIPPAGSQCAKRCNSLLEGTRT